MEVFIVIDLDNFTIVGVFDTWQKAIDEKGDCNYLEIRTSYVK